jgi:hypothetical protein
MADAVAKRDLAQPHPDRLAPSHSSYDAIVEAHRAALDRGAMFYIDPASGLSVLTAGYLAARGHCCASGCRHCPYLE